MTSHQRPTFNKASIASLRDACALLDEEPRLWTVYGEKFRAALDSMEQTMDCHRQSMQKLRGSVGDMARATRRIRTIRGKQSADRQRTWRSRPHVCESCGTPLVWQIAEVHHVVEIQDSGDSDPSNLLLLCCNCHALLHGGKLSAEIRDGKAMVLRPDEASHLEHQNGAEPRGRSRRVRRATQLKLEF